MNVITRFAPSPTGKLHIGGARTALYAYLWAKKNHGTFLLRIEDTDQARYQADAEASIIEGLRWLGLQWDGEIIHQSNRTAEYKKHADQLVAEKKAYYCFCSPDVLETMRQIQRKKGRAPRYDKRCLRLAPEEIALRLEKKLPRVIRLNIPEEGTVVLDDLVRGHIEFKTAELDDQVLLKSDGFPTYHLANVVDDHLAGVTDVIRGEEWIPSTPKHLLLYQAFGWQPPRFAHLSLFLNKGGGKLSKREGAQSLLEYRTTGYLPAAVINFIAFLGWNPKTEQEIFSLEELVAVFDLHQVHTANPIFDTDKLDWYNGEYIKRMPLKNLVELCLPYLPADVNKAYAEQVIALEQARLKHIADITDYTDFFFTNELHYETELLLWKKNTAAETGRYLTEVLAELENITDWSQKNLEHTILPWIKQHGYGNGDVLWPLRVALTGQRASPSPFEVAAVLGQKRSCQRVQTAIERLV